MPRGKGWRVASPSAASRSTAGPPGKPRPSSFAALSNASPIASSRVVPTMEYEPIAWTRKISLWPPETTAPTAGISSAAPSSSGASRCASM